MFLIFAAIVLINSGLTSGQSCATICSMNFAMATAEHTDNKTLVCGDLTDYQSCVKDLTCMSQIEKSQLLEGARNTLIQRRNINCDITVCNSTLTEKCYLLFSKDDLCGSFNKMYTCVMGVTCSESEKQQIINEIISTFKLTSCVISTSAQPSTTTTTQTTTTITTAPPVVTVACTNSLMQCSMMFFMTTMSRDPGKDFDLLCGDLANLIKCAGAANCPDSERENTIDEGKHRLLDIDIDCSRPTVPTTPSTCNKAVINQCTTTFIMNLATHSKDKTLACRDLDDFNGCISKVDCGADDKTKSTAISQSKKELDVLKISCSATSTATTTLTSTSTTATSTHSTTTTPRMEDCDASLGSCSVNFFMVTMSREPDRGILCGDLNTLKQCVGAANCPVSDKQTAISEGEDRLATLGINCSPATTTTTKMSPLSSTTTTQPAINNACSNSLEICSMNFFMTTMSRETDKVLLCGDLNTLKQCVGATNCPVSDKQTAISEGEDRLATIGINCSPATTTTTKTPPLSSTTTITQPAVNKACTDSLELCSMNFFMTTMTREIDRVLLCGDLNTLKQCVGAANCPASDKQTAISEGEDRLLSIGINCSAPVLPTTTKTTAKTEVTPCNSNPDLATTCLQTYEKGLKTHGSDTKRVCMDVTAFVNCMNKINCLDDEYRTMLISAAIEQKDAEGLKCGLTTPTTTRKTTTSLILKTTAATGSTDIGKQISIGEDCSVSSKKCELDYNTALSSKERTNELVCSVMKQYVNCMTSLNVCNFTAAVKGQIINNAQYLLDNQRISCSIKATQTQPIYIDGAYNGGQCTKSALTFLAIIVLLLLRN